MAKLVGFFLVLIAIQACLLIYQNPCKDEGGVQVCPADSSLWGFMNNPSQWADTQFILLFLGVASGITIVGLVAGSTFGFKTDFLVFAVIIGTLFSWGAITAQLYSVFNNAIAGWLFGETCAASRMITLIVIGPFALYYIWTVLEWWRGRDY